MLCARMAKVTSVHLLRRLRSFGLQRTSLSTLYDTSVASALLYAAVCWGGSNTDSDRKRTIKLVQEGQLCPGLSLDSIEVVGERRMLAKLTSIANFSSLHQTVEASSSSFSSRLLHPLSFIPTAIRLFNSIATWTISFHHFFDFFSIYLYAYLPDSSSCTCCFLSSCNKWISPLWDK